MADRLRRWANLARETQVVIATLTAIVLGVLLLATGLIPLQILGGMLAVLGIVIARNGERIPATWWTEPHTQLVHAYRVARVRTPAWAGMAGALLVILILAALTLERVIANHEVNASTRDDLGKGALAVAIFFSLVLWNLDDLPRRIVPRRIRARRPAEQRVQDT